MMNSTLVVAIALSIASVTVLKTSDASDAFGGFLKMAKECGKEHNVKKEEIFGFMKDPSKIPQITQDLKCFGKCMMDKTGVTDAAGTVVPSVVESIAEKLHMSGMVKDALEKCKNTNAGTCEGAYSLAKCFGFKG